MTSLFANGSIVTWILGFMLIEAVILVFLRGRIGLPLQNLAGVFGAGAALLLALRCALRGDAWPAIAFWLLVALGAHLFDLRWRLRIRA